MTYHHLTETERYQIYVLQEAGKKQGEIAALLQRSPSTISRELRRNRSVRGYSPRQAHYKACARQRISAGNSRRISENSWNQIEACVREEWSPDQIAGTTGLASAERIYMRVYQDKAEGGDLWKHLRCQRKRRKRYGSGRHRRGTLVNRRPIGERPAVVARRSRIGDWEGDTIIGKSHCGAVVTLAERKSQFVLLRKVARCEASEVNMAIQAAMNRVKRVSHTLTLDNGKEFAQHEGFGRKLGMDVYFADPYAAWQRGLIEQINGLVRQYIPKGSSLAQLTDADIALIETKLNNRPRKLLGYKTPREVLLQSARKQGIALRI